MVGLNWGTVHVYGHMVGLGQLYQNTEYVIQEVTVPVYRHDGN